jgi:hypothetical protein
MAVCGLVSIATAHRPARLKSASGATKDERLVFHASSRDQTATGTLEPPAHGPRQFGRLRPPPPAPPPELARTEDEVLPFDSTKTFIGPNGTYYDEHWRWMEWRGHNHSWNWAAALSFGGWLAYRRLYGAMALHLGWLGLLMILAVNGVPLTLLALLQLGVTIALGLYGNLIYRQFFRRTALRVARDHTDHAARIAALANAGGTDRRAVYGMIAAVAGLAAIVAGMMRLTGAPVEFDLW